MRKKLLLLMIFTTVASAGASGVRGAESVRPLLRDQFANLDNWWTYGGVSWAPPDPDIPYDTGRMILAATSSARAYPWLADHHSIPLPDEFSVTFDVTLENFAPGDGFELEYRIRTYTDKDILRCEDQAAGEREFFQCNLYREQDGERTLIPRERGGANFETTFVNGRRYTITLRQIAGYTALIVEPTNHETPGYTLDWDFNRRSATFEPLGAHPAFVVTRLMVGEPRQARVIIQNFLYAPAGYKLADNIETLSQLDERWSSVILGHTSDQTIGQIGCLLTDLVMILRHYGYEFFPDGRELTPITLNDWLKAQPDGYINQNLLNIAAVTRLSTQLHDYYATQGANYPKLEYRYDAGQFSLGKRLARVTHFEPYIQEAPGHFVVVSGYDFDVNQATMKGHPDPRVGVSAR